MNTIGRLVLLACPLIGVATTTYTVDPGGLYRAGTEQRIADILLKGENAAAPSDFDERVVQRFVVQGLVQPPDAIVLGSSRMLQVRSELVTNQRAFNHSVSGASVEDFIAVVGLYERRGWAPRRLLVGLDPWLLNRHRHQLRWKSLEVEYLWMSRHLGLAPTENYWFSTLADNQQIAKVLALESPSYFQASIGALPRYLSSRTERVHAVAAEPAESTVLLADGSRLPDLHEENQTVAEVRTRAAIEASTEPMYSLGGFAEIDLDAYRKLARLLGLLTQTSSVSIVLPPYHPLVFEAMGRRAGYRRVREAEEAFRELAATLGLEVLGSYDPNKCGCSEAEFLDGMHPRSTCIARILRR